MSWVLFIQLMILIAWVGIWVGVIVKGERHLQ